MDHQPENPVQGVLSEKDGAVLGQNVCAFFSFLLRLVVVVVSTNSSSNSSNSSEQ